jgi:hypothetical protein
MKFLILFLLSFSLFAQLSPEQRRANERVMILKDLAAAHCQQLSGELRQECLENFRIQIKAALKQSSKKLVADAVRQADSRVNAQIKEEGLMAEYSAKLAAVNVTHSCTTSACLIAKYNEYLESIKPVEPEPTEPQASDSQIGGATESQIGG